MLRRRCGVIGDPAGHSLSPAIHRAGYEANSLVWAYEAYSVPPAELDGFVRARIQDPVWAGLSVTAPHKEAILAFGEADEPTRLLGAGNTIVFGGEGARVFNTDVPGFVRAWRAHGLDSPTTAAILGNGATARSILLALAGLGIREVRILARRPERAAGILELAATLGVFAEVHGLDEAPVDVDLLANTIPAAATRPHAPALAGAAKVIFDAVYDPWPTPLGEAAATAGRVALNGLDLLAGQAVDQFFLLTGARVSFEACRSAAEQELRRRAGL
ncbi:MULTISPECIES: shikimate dehydrogenase family protein [unclassified Tessaracoccus]|uniref:shikimate dehydrogenase family protein n=1 Tax=unclassified Tessaracoccus TaxID=2635419 RepID=UPI001600E001|nr:MULTISPECIES: shikimate dehydrogenase [unclassified Tessaracoccus]MBB1512717.1 shikimate dehydrogenase [Tessaracoccus sp. MC1627]MBB1516315.1 shikimate dehydrogenase [Tessaracoccus sp. MC1679]